MPHLDVVQEMSLSIGANIYGFVIGGSMFLLQLALFGMHHFLNSDPHPDVPMVILWVFLGFAMLVFALAVLFWVSSVILVYPASLVYRRLRIRAKEGGIIGCMAAGLLCWLLLKSPGLGSNMLWQFYWSCLSSSLLAGSITGYVLGKLTAEEQSKSEMATPRKPFV